MALARVSEVKPLLMLPVAVGSLTSQRVSVTVQVAPPERFAETFALPSVNDVVAVPEAPERGVAAEPRRVCDPFLRVVLAEKLHQLLPVLYTQLLEYPRDVRPYGDGGYR